MRQPTKNGRRATAWNLLFAVIVTGLSVQLCFITSLAPILPFGLVLLFAVVISAYVGGLWPGLLSTVLSAIAAAFLLNRLIQLAANAHVGMRPGLIWAFAVVFAAMGVIVSFLFEALHRSRRASEASQRELAAILANINDAIVTTDASGCIEYLNQTAVSLLQCDRQRVLGEPFEAVVRIRNADDMDDSIHLVDRVRDTAQTVHINNSQVLLRDDGKQIPIETTAAPVRDWQGKVISVVVTLRDCSAQREVENILRERLALQERFERIAAVVPGAICEFQTSPDGSEKLLYGSPGYKEIFGVDPAIFAESTAGFRDMIIAENPVSRANTDAAARWMQPINIEQLFNTAHRGKRWITISAKPQPQADGSVLWHGVLADTTESKRWGERLRASQAQLQAALDAGAMGILCANLDNGTVELDATARHLWGLNEGDYPTVTFADLRSMLHPQSPRIALKDFEQLASKTLVSNQYHLLMKDGVERWLVCQGRVYRDEETGDLVAAGVVLDITQDHWNEQQRLRSQKLEALGVLAGGIAHDFNNLLLAISGNADLLLADLRDNDPAHTSVGEIVKAATRASELVRRILNFSSANEFLNGDRVADVGPLMDEVQAVTRATMPANVVLTAHIDEALPGVAAEAGQVHQAVTNLMTNAVEACVLAGGVIELTASKVCIDDATHQQTPEVKPGNYVCISVADTGKGMEPDILPRIFDPFFTTKVAGSGNGLGLAVVHGIMKSVDGAILMNSVRGQGAKFSLYFPVSNQGAGSRADAANVATHDAATVPEAQKNAVHILYVDDEEALIFLMSRTLERMGHRVTACESPEDALAVFTANPDGFDLVVSDMAMPVMNGIELAERMLAIRPQLRFIITSGFIDAQDVEQAQRVGVSRMIMKPNTVEELSLAVANVLRDQQIATSA